MLQLSRAHKLRTPLSIHQTSIPPQWSTRFREQVVTRNAAQTQHLLVGEMIISGTSQYLIRCLKHGFFVDRISAGTTRFR